MLARILCLGIFSQGCYEFSHGSNDGFGTALSFYDTCRKLRPAQLNYYAAHAYECVDKPLASSSTPTGLEPVGRMA